MTLISNKYKIIEQIGEGTFGKVFSGKYIKNNEDIAIKIQFKSLINVLQHEARVYRQLININGIPLIRNYGFDQGFHYLILEMLDYSLAKLDISNNDLLKYFNKSIEIIRDIHSQGIIHRDIKPDNLMIKDRNGIKRLYIIDFGLAKRFLDLSGNHISIKKDKNIIGTIKYASINIHYGIESSRRDDLESLCYTFISLYKINFN